MSDVAFVFPPRPGRLDDLADALRRELERQGMVTSVHARFPGPDPARLYVLVDPGRFVEALGVAALPARPLLRRTLTLTAQGAPGGPDAPPALLKAVGRAFDTSQATVTSLHLAGVEARLLRPGYCPEWDGFDPGGDAEREIDIAVLDGNTARRRRLLARAADRLAHHRTAIHLLDAGAVDGERRRALLRRSKVAVALHAGDDTRLDWLQAMDAMHSGAVLVTEQSSELGPLDPGRQLFVASELSWAWIVDRLLVDEDARATARRAAYERVRDWLPFSLSVGVVRAALLELLGLPLDDGAERDVEPLELGAEGGGTADADLALQLRRTRDDLRDVRRQLGWLRASATSNPRAPEATVSRRSPAWDTHDVPALAVLLTLGDDPAAALRSLAALLAAPSDDTEFVLVTPGGADPEVTAWCDAHPDLAIAQVHHAPGLAAARNAGLGLVRAPICLVLDAGVTPYRRWREGLVDVLAQDPGCGFVHGLQALRTPAGELDDLGGTAGGEPAAPIAARTELLREAGGFAGESPRGGVATDELWRRVTMPGRHVPEILSQQLTPSAQELDVAVA